MSAQLKAGRIRATAGFIGAAVASGLLVAIASLVTSTAAQADTAPAAATGFPATVSSDALPTMQVNGVVSSQVTVGNTVYATGAFSYARPAGQAGSATHVGETAVGNIVAYTLTITNTGQVDYPILTVTDDLSDVLDDAVLQSPLEAGLTLSGTSLTFDGALPLTDNASNPLVVTYIVKVDNPDGGNEVLANVITGGTDGGNCPGAAACKTTNPTNPAAPVVLAFTGCDSRLQLLLAMLLIGSGGALGLIAAGYRRRRARA